MKSHWHLIDTDVIACHRAIDPRTKSAPSNWRDAILPQFGPKRESESESTLRPIGLRCRERWRLDFGRLVQILNELCDAPMRTVREVIAIAASTAMLRTASLAIKTKPNRLAIARSQPCFTATLMPASNANAGQTPEDCTKLACHQRPRNAKLATTATAMPATKAMSNA